MKSAIPPLEGRIFTESSSSTSGSLIEIQALREISGSPTVQA
jgi:hypothetical protein